MGWTTFHELLTLPYPTMAFALYRHPSSDIHWFHTVWFLQDNWPLSLCVKKLVAWHKKYRTLNFSHWGSDLFMKNKLQVFPQINILWTLGIKIRVRAMPKGLGLGWGLGIIVTQFRNFISWHRNAIKFSKLCSQEDVHEELAESLFHRNIPMYVNVVQSDCAKWREDVVWTHEGWLKHNCDNKKWANGVLYDNVLAT